MNNVEDICNSIDKLSNDDITRIVEFCNKKLSKVDTSTKEAKIIKKLKNSYKDNLQLAKFANGFMLKKYEKESADYMVSCSFSFEICGEGISHCNSKSCKHIQVIGGDTYDREQPNFEEIEYNIRNSYNETIDEVFFGEFFEAQLNVDPDAIDLISEDFDLDSKCKKRLKYFFEDILQLIG